MKYDTLHDLTTHQQFYIHQDNMVDFFSKVYVINEFIIHAKQTINLFQPDLNCIKLKFIIKYSYTFGTITIFRTI